MRLIILTLTALFISSCKKNINQQINTGQYSNDFELQGRWKCSDHLTEEASHSGRFCTFSDASNEYTATFSIPFSEVKKFSAVEVKVSAMSQEESPAAKLVVSVEKGDTKFIYNDLDIASLLQKRKNWNTITSRVKIVSGIPDDATVIIYGWDTGKKRIYWDDFNITFY